MRPKKPFYYFSLKKFYSLPFFYYYLQVCDNVLIFFFIYFGSSNMEGSSESDNKNTEENAQDETVRCNKKNFFFHKRVFFCRTTCERNFITFSQSQSLRKIRREDPSQRQRKMP